MRILIVEDELTSRLFVKKMLEKQGECELAINGVEALDKVMDAIEAGNYFDLICLDIMMPKVDGIKVLRTIRDIEKTTKNIEPAKIIMTTALGDSATIEEAYEAGCEAFAQKPIEMDKLLETIKKLGLPIVD